MPYTPPSQQSPTSTRTSSPSLSRNSSYSHDLSGRASPSPRPHLPRSISSATYLNKHRRSPSTATSPTITTTTINAPQYDESSVVASKDAESLLALSGPVRQSPPPVNGFPMPTGAMVSPPGSSENSDGDESTSRNARRREVEHTWSELQQAVRSMSIKRDPSPAQPHIITASVPATQVTSPSSLSPEARKISHSRSSTETAIVISGPQFSESPTNVSPLDESDDEFRRGKPPLVRKKSGELVKPALRPSSRRRYSSMPGTPTYSKSVHFNDNGNQTRHFLQVDRPSAISADSSPVETYDSETEYPFGGDASRKADWDIKLANFPENNAQRTTTPVWVEKIFLSADSKNLIGQVAVANISFHKSVVARFTLDYWKTTSEVSAEYSHDVRRELPVDGHDRFSFSIHLSDQANLENKTLLLCVRYNVNGQEYWDNNNNTNFQIDFVRKIKAPHKHSPQSTLGARPVSAIPRSRNSHPATRGRSPSVDDDIVSRFDTGASTYHFGPSSGTREDLLLGDDSQPTIKFKPKSKRDNLFPSGPTQPAHGLGGRYDFGASLSAALSTAQDKLGKQSGLMASNKDKAKSDSGYFAQDASNETEKAVDAPSDRPDTLATDRPAIGSAQYKDLVSKFCYFTPSSAGKLSPVVPQKSPAVEAKTDKRVSDHSGSSTPSPTKGVSPSLDGTNETNSSFTTSPFVSQSASPVGMTSGGINVRARGTSPVSFGYPYHSRDGYFANAPAPTAIHG